MTADDWTFAVCWCTAACLAPATSRLSGGRSVSYRRARIANRQEGCTPRPIVRSIKSVTDAGVSMDEEWPASLNTTDLRFPDRGMEAL